MPETAPGLQALIEETPAMLWRGNQDGRCVYLNRAQREFWDVEDLIPDEFDWSSTVVLEDHEKVLGSFNDGMAFRRPFTCEAGSVSANAPAGKELRAGRGNASSEEAS